MRGFPVCVNTKQDFENLLVRPDFKVKVMAELKRIINIKGSKITKVSVGVADGIYK